MTELKGNNRILTRTALLLALTLIFQSIRVVIPLPPFLSIFVVGSLVNACLLVGVELLGVRPAILISVVAPGIAYLQQMLPLPIFILPVALANTLYVIVYSTCLGWGREWGIMLAASGKSLFLYMLFSWMVNLITINPKIVVGIMFAMSWPQFITAAIGGILASMVMKRVGDV